MKLTTLFALGTLPTTALFLHLHAAPDARASIGAVPDAIAPDGAGAHVDALHEHLRALHAWLMPDTAEAAPAGAPAPSTAPNGGPEAAPDEPRGATVPAGAHPSIGYDLARTGIEWHRGLDAVLGGEKPILLFQLLGEFDQVHC